MKHIVKTEEEWLALRLQYVTASEAAVLVGCDPYSSPAKIRNPTPFEGNAFTKVGQMLEPIVVNVTNEVLGTSFTLYEASDGTKEFYTEGNLGATPDAHQDRQMLLECKTVNSKAYLKYSAMPPNKYIIQLLVQLLCTGIETGYLALLDTNMKTIKEYEKFLKNPDLDQDWSITVFKVTQNIKLCDILKVEAQKFKDNKTFKVNSDLKKRVKLLLLLNCEKII